MRVFLKQNSKKSYDNKINELLVPATYKNLVGTNTINNKESPQLYKTDFYDWFDFKKQSSISEESEKRLCKTEAAPPILYGLPKIHKLNAPLRPIISTNRISFLRIGKISHRITIATEPWKTSLKIQPISSVKYKGLIWI